MKDQQSHIFHNKISDNQKQCAPEPSGTWTVTASIFV